MKISGYYNITPKLTDYDRFYLLNFNLTSHLKRDVNLLNKIYDKRNGYNGYYGDNGEFFINYKVDANGVRLNYKKNDILIRTSNQIVVDNNPPGDQPNIICPWKPTLDGKKFISNNYEIYHNNYGWLKWLLKNFFIKNNYELNGEVSIINNNNKIIVKIEKNKIIRKIKDNQQITNLNNKNKKTKLNNRKKSNVEILEEIIEKTRNKEILWVKDNHSYADKYYTHIPIEDRIDILINLYNGTSDFNNYMNIYIKKGDKKSFLTTIKNLKINELINYVI